MSEFVIEITRNNELRFLRKCKNLFVRFGLEGVLLYSASSKRATLVYDAARAEGDYNLEFDGSMFGFESVFCASLARNLHRHQTGPDHSQLESHARHALDATRRLLASGFGPDASDLGIQYQVVFGTSQRSADQFAVSPVINNANALQKARAKWTFLDDVKKPALLELAQTLVKTGKLQSTPTAYPSRGSVLSRLLIDPK